MHSTSGAWKEYSFQPRWRCCWERIWLARVSGHSNSASRSALPAILRRRLRGIRPRPPRGPLRDAQIGLSQPYCMPAGEAIEPLDRGMQQLGVGRKRDGLGLHGGVDRDPLEGPRAQRAGLVRDPQALGQQKLEPLAEALPPMAQVEALVREGVLEELLAGEVLEIGVIDPTLTHLLVG